MDSMEQSIKAYIRARKRLDSACEAYIKTCKAVGQSTVVLSETDEVFTALNEALFWGISLYERKYECADDFMSAVKYVSNTIKHQIHAFQIYSFCHPGIAVSVEVDDSLNEPVIQAVSIEPALVFGKLDDVPARQKGNRQRNQYIQLLQEKPILEVMIRFDTVLQESYPSDLWVNRQI